MKLSLRRISGLTSCARNSQRAWQSRAALLLELSVGSERGLGEASPLPGFSPDTLESAEAALGAVDMCAVARALDIEDIENSLSALAALLPPNQPAARMALESAALDLRGRQSKHSAPSLLGADPRAERMLAWLVGVLDPESLNAIRGAGKAGYHHFKIKMGGLGKATRELAALHSLRLELGGAPRLRLDANRGWSVAEARSVCRSLEALDIEFLEEPTAQLTMPLDTPVPMALDESLQGVALHELAALARRSGATFVNLKPMVLGGLSHCIKLSRCASALNLGVIVSHSFDGPLALIASAALALALPGQTAHGLAPHAGLEAWPRLPLPIMDGVLRAWSSPGLGSGLEQLS